MFENIRLLTIRKTSYISRENYAMHYLTKIAKLLIKKACLETRQAFPTLYQSLSAM
jgi:hypothetical protein